MSDALFDATVYGPAPKTRRKAEPKATTFEARVSAKWRYVVGGQPGVVHAVRSRANGVGGWLTWCDKTAGARTFDPGQQIAGCKACLDRGAPRPTN